MYYTKQYFVSLLHVCNVQIRLIDRLTFDTCSTHTHTHTHEGLQTHFLRPIVITLHYSYRSILSACTTALNQIVHSDCMFRTCRQSVQVAHRMNVLHYFLQGVLYCTCSMTAAVRQPFFSSYSQRPMHARLSIRVSCYAFLRQSA